MYLLLVQTSQKSRVGYVAHSSVVCDKLKRFRQNTPVGGENLM
jgi:hypothetical protein